MAGFWHVECRNVLSFFYFSPTESIGVANRGPVRRKNSYKRRLNYAQNKDNDSRGIYLYEHRSQRSTFNWAAAIIHQINACTWTRSQRISLCLSEIQDRKKMIRRKPYKGPSPRYKQRELLFD